MKRWEIRRVPLTNNQVRRLLFGPRWGAVGADTKAWNVAIRATCGLPLHGTVQGKHRVTIHVTRAKKQDPDNAFASVKPILDGLRRNGWLVDDTTEFLELHVEETATRDKALHGTVIEWEPIDS